MCLTLILFIYKSNEWVYIEIYMLWDKKIRVNNF